MTDRVDLDARSDFFTTGEAENSSHLEPAGSRRPRPARAGGDGRGRRPARADAPAGRCLADRGVERLMVEGGGVVHTQFLADDLVDELQLVVSPFFVGDSSAPRFVSDGRFPWNAGRRATLAEVRQIGDVVLLRYALSPGSATTERRCGRTTARRSTGRCTARGSRRTRPASSSGRRAS